MKEKIYSLYQKVSPIINFVGIAVIVFWGLEVFWNEKRHPWLDFNVDHPVVMVAGFICAVLFVYNKITKKR